MNLNLFLVLGINLPWTLTCLRNYVVVPDTPVTRAFCVAYDVFVSKPFFRNNVLLMFWSINGFTASYYFPMMLLDIANNSQQLALIGRSVTDNAMSLGWVVYVFIVVNIIYAQFGLEYFEDFFTYDPDETFVNAETGEEEPAQGCHSVVSCFFLLFYKGVGSGGNLQSVLSNVSNRDQPEYLRRVAFDLFYFIVVGIILFNVITGIVVDGFGALREEENTRKDILENACFVCGFSRAGYDALPHFRGEPFDAHQSSTHDFWTYVHYYVYLKRKEKTEFSGVESYVWAMMAEHRLDWIPVRNCGALQAVKQAALAADELARRTGDQGSSRESENGEGASAKLLEKLAADMSDLRQGVGSIMQRDLRGASLE